MQNKRYGKGIRVKDEVHITEGLKFNSISSFQQLKSVS